MIIANNNNKSQLVVLSGPVPISVSLGKIDLWKAVCQFLFPYSEPLGKKLTKM